MHPVAQNSPANYWSDFWMSCPLSVILTQCGIWNLGPVRGPWDTLQTWECLGAQWTWGPRDKCGGVRNFQETVGW